LPRGRLDAFPGLFDQQFRDRPIEPENTARRTAFKVLTVAIRREVASPVERIFRQGDVAHFDVGHGGDGFEGHLAGTLPFGT
jgi:hypothetical protein